MNHYAVCKTIASPQEDKKPIVLLHLTHAVILCTAACACAAVLDTRLALALAGAALMLGGCISMIASRRVAALCAGVLVTLAGGMLTAWSILRILHRQPLALLMDSRLPALAVQLCFIAAGLACTVLPLIRMHRRKQHCTRRVCAQCISDTVGQNLIVWRYRVGDRMYDFEEKHCTSFFLPQMGDRTVLRVDPQQPENACRCDRAMTAAQTVVGLLFVIEGISAVLEMVGGASV